MINSPEGKYILQKLTTSLPVHFYYHNADHTLDVYHCADAIATEEKINDADKRLLLVAALYHDSGYLTQINDHETASANIARESLTQFGYTPQQVEQVCAIIMATRVPQMPTTLLEEIICDADLDYLGRDDFHAIGQKLYEELLATGQLKYKDEWDNKQAAFMQQHRYFTATSIKNRQPKQQENLRSLQQKSTT